MEVETEGRSQLFIYSYSGATHHDGDITSGIRFWGPLVSTQSSAARGRADEHLSESGIEQTALPRAMTFLTGAHFWPSASLGRKVKQRAQHLNTVKRMLLEMLGANLEHDELHSSYSPVIVGLGRLTERGRYLSSSNALRNVCNIVMETFEIF